MALVRLELANHQYYWKHSLNGASWPESPPNLEFWFDRSQHLANVICTLWPSWCLKPQQTRSWVRADKVLGPATKICSSRMQRSKNPGLRTTSNRGLGWQKENFRNCCFGGKRYFCWISLAKRLILARRAFVVTLDLLFLLIHASSRR